MLSFKMLSRCRQFSLSRLLYYILYSGPKRNGNIFFEPVQWGPVFIKGTQFGRWKNRVPPPFIIPSLPLHSMKPPLEYLKKNVWCRITWYDWKSWVLHGRCCRYSLFLITLQEFCVFQDNEDRYSNPDLKRTLKFMVPLSQFHLCLCIVVSVGGFLKNGIWTGLEFIHFAAWIFMYWSK